MSHVVEQYDEVIGDRNKINTKLHDIIGGSIEARSLPSTHADSCNNAYDAEMGCRLHAIRDPDVQALEPRR